MPRNPRKYPSTSLVRHPLVKKLYWARYSAREATNYLNSLTIQELNKEYPDHKELSVKMVNAKYTFVLNAYNALSALDFPRYDKLDILQMANKHLPSI